MSSGQIEKSQNGSKDCLVVLYCDGGFSKKRNPHFPAYGTFLPTQIKKSENKESIISFEKQKFINFKNSISTHNMAEIAIMITALRYAENLDNEKVIIRSDSKFALGIAKGEYSSKKQRLKTITYQLRELVRRTNKNIHLEHIKGDKMKEILGH